MTALALRKTRSLVATARSSVGKARLLVRQAVWKIKADRSLAAVAELAMEAISQKARARSDPELAKCSWLVRSGDPERALSEIDRLLEQSRGTRGETDRRLLSLIKVDALNRMGRCADALLLVRAIEKAHGASSPTRERTALIHSFAGRHEECVEACTEALLAGPSPKAARELRHLRAEALCALGRHGEAFAFLVSSLHRRRPSNADLVALRRTVRTPQAVEQFFVFLAPWFSGPGQVSAVSLFQFSLACRDNHLMARANFAARERFIRGVERSSFGAKPPVPRTHWVRDASRALVDLRHDLDSTGLDFFLVSGTLLGCVRDRSIIGHDKDLDVGMFTDLPPADLRDTVARFGRFKVRPLVTDHLVQIQHSNGVLIDIFLHWKENGLIYHEGQKARWWNSDFELQEREFLGHSFKIPSAPERYLTENYGEGWGKPEPNFETFVDTPNMITADGGHMEWYFLTKLFDYYDSGKPVQFAKVWKALDELARPDAAVRAAATRILNLIHRKNAA